MRKLVVILTMLTFFSCKEERKALRLVTKLEGTPLPEFTILTSEGKYLPSNTLQHGKPLVIFYFDPGCIQCRVQTRNMIDVITKLKDVQICMLTPAEHKRAYQYAKHFRLGRYTNVVVGVDTGYVLGKHFQATSVPYTAIYDKAGRFTDAYTGRMGGKQWIAVTHPPAKRTSSK